jgi:hypothetical protein
MQRLNGFRFYELGTRLAPLAEISNATPYKSCFYDLWFARAAVRELLKSFPINLCRGDAQKLVDAISEIVPDDWTKASQRDAEEEIGYKWYSIREAKETFEHVLSAEMTSLDAYLLTQLGIYNTADLVERADRAFPESTRKVITEEAQKDFRQGGRCLAFELPTASGFHTMRATEAVLRQYHKMVFPAVAKPPEMAQCINELRKSGEDPKVLNILDSIRDLHRNPQMHPDSFLSMDEAIRLFDISKSVINAMADRISVMQSTASTTSAAIAPGSLSTNLLTCPTTP